MRHALAALALALAACRVAEPSSPAQPAATATSGTRAAPAPEMPPAAAKPANAPRAAPSWHAGDPVRVRLASAGRDGRVVVEGGRGGKLVLTRTDDLVAASDGRKAREIAIAPANPARGLWVGDRRYPGELRVRARPGAQGLEVELVCDLESYVAGVVSAELPLWSALETELETQAIAARSYAACALAERSTKTREPYLFDDTRDQVFRGAPDMPARGEARKVAERLAQAVAATRGLVLVEGGRVVDARFCAACGGRTADAKTIAPEADFACLRAVACEPCAAHADATGDDGVRWSWTATPQALAELARGLALGERVTRIAPERDATGRWIAVTIAGPAGEKRLRFEELRERLPGNGLKSNWIDSTWPREGEPIARGLRFDGRGRGHGVGLCQAGAHGYAERGWSAERILALYFPGASVEPLAGGKPAAPVPAASAAPSGKTR